MLVMREGDCRSNMRKGSGEEDRVLESMSRISKTSSVRSGMNYKNAHIWEHFACVGLEFQLFLNVTAIHESMRASSRLGFNSL